MTKKRNEPSDQPAFEESLQRLEEIVRLLEEGQIGLSEALERYEEGVKLLRGAYEQLKHAERRIELLTGVDAEGNPLIRPLDDTATFSQGENPHPGPLPEGQGADGGIRSKGDGGSDVDAPGGLF